MEASREATAGDESLYRFFNILLPPATLLKD